MKNHRLFVLVLAMAMQSANATLPVTFISGSVIKASEINANFQYLESLISSAVQSGANSYVKASIVLSTEQVSQNIYTVPLNAPSNYLIRQIYSPMCINKATLTIGDVVFPFAGGVLTGLSIPVRPGEVVAIVCQINTQYTQTAAIVLSK